MFIVVLCGCSVINKSSIALSQKAELVFMDVNSNFSHQIVFCDVHKENHWSCPNPSIKTSIKIEEEPQHHKNDVESFSMIKIDNVLFDFDQSAMRNVDKVKLISALPTLSNTSIVLKAYTDEIGSENYNLNLSQERANHVKDFLIELGIKTQRIKTESFGKCCFVASNENDKSRALNRRVEIYAQEQSRLE